MTLFQRIKKFFGKEPAPQQQTRQPQVRMYQGAKNSRLTSGWATTITSADAELGASLRPLRSRSRALIRDAAYAKRAKVIVVNNVIGGGIGIQGQVKNSRGTLQKRINDDIEEAWVEWSRADNCHTGGALHFADLERMAMGEVFDAGEVFIRKHFRKFGNSKIPYALEIIESERVIDEFTPIAIANNRIRMGVESDEFHRPIAYWIRKIHPGETHFTAGETDAVERVPAEQIIHLRLIDRWPQTRGEPWLHAVVRKLNDMDGYSEAEIIAARAAACYMGFIETNEEYGEETETGAREIELEAGIVERLIPGEKFNSFNPNRPNNNMDPFMRMMLREVAAGVGPSYESLSRDYSQSNYSSSRLALLDDRDLWRVFQMWFIRSFREVVHREFLQQAVAARVIQSIPVEDYFSQPLKFEKARFKPRGWGWVDPAKEVDAYKEAIKSGLTTASHVVSLTGDGRDIEDVYEERDQELKLAKEKGLAFDTDPDQYKQQKPKPAQQQPGVIDEEEEITVGGNGNGKQKNN